MVVELKFCTHSLTLLLYISSTSIRQRGIRYWIKSTARHCARYSIWSVYKLLKPLTNRSHRCKLLVLQIQLRNGSRSKMWALPIYIVSILCFFFSFCAKVQLGATDAYVRYILQIVFSILTVLARWSMSMTHFRWRQTFYTHIFFRVLCAKN